MFLAGAEDPQPQALGVDRGDDVARERPPLAVPALPEGVAVPRPRRNPVPVVPPLEHLVPSGSAGNHPVAGRRGESVEPVTVVLGWVAGRLYRGPGVGIGLLVAHAVTFSFAQKNPPVSLRWGYTRWASSRAES